MATVNQVLAVLDARRKLCTEMADDYAGNDSGIITEILRETAVEYLRLYSTIARLNAEIDAQE